MEDLLAAAMGGGEGNVDAQLAAGLAAGDEEEIVEEDTTKQVEEEVAGEVEEVEEVAGEEEEVEEVVDEDKCVVKSDAEGLSARGADGDEDMGEIDEEEDVINIETEEEAVLESAGDSQYEVREPKEEVEIEEENKKKGEEKKEVDDVEGVVDQIKSAGVDTTTAVV